MIRAPFGSLDVQALFRWGQERTLLGRRAAPEGAVEADAINLPIECVRGGELPLLIAVHVNGELVAEVVDTDPIASEGSAGLFAQTLGVPSQTVFDSFKVSVPAD